MAIESAIAVLRRAAQYLKQIDPEWKHALDELIPPRRLKQSKKKSKSLSPAEAELSALFELRWVGTWLDRLMKGDLSITFVEAKRRVDGVLQRIQERSQG